MQRVKRARRTQGVGSVAERCERRPTRADDKAGRTSRGTADRIGGWQAAISSSDGSVKGGGAPASSGVVSGCVIAIEAASTAE
jgi:hypothetical protein